MPKGHLLTFTRADLEPLWTDPALRIGDIACRLGCGREALRHRVRAWGLPPRPTARSRSASIGQRGYPLSIPREVLEPLWLDPTLSIRDIAERLGCSDRPLAYYAPRLGLPTRAEVRGQWREGNCDTCHCNEQCRVLQATADPFPCQVAVGAEWDVEEMTVRRDGDRVGSSNFEAVIKVHLGGKDD